MNLIKSSGALPAEDASPRGESFFHDLVEACQKLIWSADAQGRLRFVNGAARRIYGYAPEEMVGRLLSDFQNGEQAPRDAARFASLEAGAESLRFETLHRRKDGAPVWLDFYAVVQRDAQGRSRGFAGSAEDISERKRAEEIVSRSQDRLLLAERVAHTGNWSYEVATGKIQWSDGMWPIYGMAPCPDTLDYAALLAVVHPEDRAKHDAYMAALLALAPGTPAVPRFEYRLIRPDGGERTVEVFCQAEFGAQGGPVRFFGVVHDVSEHKRAELTLRESEAGFRRLVECAPEAVVLLECNTGKFSMVNPAAEKLYKLSAAELCRLGPVELSPPLQPDGQPSVEKARHYIAQAMAGETPVFEWTHRDAQGRDIPCEVRLLRLKINDRDVVRGSIAEIRGRNEAEIAIRESEEKFHAVFDQSPLAIVLTTLPEGLVADANTAAEILVGRKIAEVRGKTTVEMDIWADPVERDLYLQLLQRDGSVNDFEATVRRSDGKFLTVLYHGRVVRIGGRSYVLNSMLDITGRKQAEESVRQNREQFIDLFDNAPIGYHEVNADGLITRINSTELKMLGYDATELMGQPVWTISADENASHEAVLAKLRGREPVTKKFERNFRRKDRTTFPVLIEDRILRNKAGEVTGIRSVVQDITASKQAEEKAQHLANFPELNPNPVLEFTAEGELVYHNPAALSMAQKAGFSNLKELLPARVKPIVAECLDTGLPQLRLETKHGQHTLSWSFYPISAQRVVHCYVGDITTRLQLEEQFRQAQKMEAIGQLSGGVAHDFNNLLTVILGNIGLLQSSGLVTPDLTEPLQAIGHAANRAANLTKQLLAFSRQQVMQQQDLDLNAVVGHISKMLRRVIGETVKIRLDYALQSLPIHADPGMLEQIILNLCINARDAMPQGGQLTLRTTTIDISKEEARLMMAARAGSFALLVVSDTGTGISPENMKRVFEPFFTTKEVGKGTGLGLASVYGIAQQHNGWVAVESELGRGTTFTVYLPLLAMAPPSNSRATAVAQIPRGTETILLVEDDLAVQMVTKVTLTRLGYQVLVASNGHQALRIWQERKKDIHLVLTDMIMPEGLSGKDIAQQFKKERPGIRLIFMSGYSADIAGTDFPQAEGDFFIGKPFEMHVLANVIRKSLDIVRSASTPPW